MMEKPRPFRPVSPPPGINRPLGCGLWLVWFFLGLFTAEWALLWLLVHNLPREWLLIGVISAIVATIIGGWLIVFVRLQWRKR